MTATCIIKIFSHVFFLDKDAFQRVDHFIHIACFLAI